jgi:hypothetical protein
LLAVKPIETGPHVELNFPEIACENVIVPEAALALAKRPLTEAVVTVVFPNALDDDVVPLTEIFPPDDTLTVPSRMIAPPV